MDRPRLKVYLFIIVGAVVFCFLAGLPVHFFSAGLWERLFHQRTIVDRHFEDFLAWMRRAGYSEDIVAIYACNYRDPVLRPILLDYLKIRLRSLRVPEESRAGYAAFRSPSPLHLQFIEVVPTDAGAVSVGVDPAALERFRLYLEERFGKAIVIDFRSVAAGTREVFTDPFSGDTGSEGSGRDERLELFLSRFEPPCIVRFDVELLDGRVLPSIWNIRHCAILRGRAYRLTDSVESFDGYAHEFGHNIGLDHQFIDPENPPREGVFSRRVSEKHAGRHVGIDDIMIKTKPPENPSVGHYVSPLSRYVLEPLGGYADAGRMGAAYNALYVPETVQRIKECACSF